MTAKHTPGPWALHSEVVATKDKLYNICDCHVSYSLGVDEMQANARLIAAAPELLAMLIDLREQGGFENLNSLEECDALIAKATGEDAP